MESRVHNERCMPGSVRGTRKPTGESRQGAECLLYRRFSDGRHVLRFEPKELLLRLCALVPPRRFNMIRYSGL